MADGSRMPWGGETTSAPMSAFPRVRMRRNRRDGWNRRLVAENAVSIDDFIWPIFVAEGEGNKEAIDAMPGQFRWSPDRIAEAAREAADLAAELAVAPDLESRRAGYRALGRLGDEFLPALARQAAHQQGARRAKALEHMVWLDKRAAADAISEDLYLIYLRDPDPEVRVLAVILSSYGGPQGPAIGRELGRLRREDPSPAVRRQAARALGRGVDDPPATPGRSPWLLAWAGLLVAALLGLLLGRPRPGPPLRTSPASV